MTRTDREAAEGAHGAQGAQGAQAAQRAQSAQSAVAEARRRLQEMITSGRLRPGQRLGAERALAADLGVSRATLRQALSLLEQQGAVRRVPGRGGGTFVGRPKIERDLSSVAGVPALLRDQGYTAGSRVVGAAIVGADEPTAAALSLQPGELVTEIVRIRLADGEPISLENARFPALRFPGLLELPLGGSIYELLAARYGVRPAEAVERIEAVPATDTQAAVLGVAPGVPLLSVTRTASAEDGTPFEFSHDLFRGDRTAFLVRSSGTAAGHGERGRLIHLPPT